jgi:hypothetical protein
MGLFGGGKEKKDKKALDLYLASPSIGGSQIDEYKKAVPEAQAVLFALVKDSTDHDHRFRALVGLQQLGITQAMVPVIVAALRDPDDLVQESAANIVANYRECPEIVIPALVAVYNEHAGNTLVLLQVLGEYGPGARAAVPTVKASLARPLEALAAARCLAHIGTEDLDPVERSFVDVLTDRAKEADLRALGEPMVVMLETFLGSCVPWKMVDAIPAWRRTLEAYALVGARPAAALAPVLKDLSEYGDWKLRGETGVHYMEISRAKMVAGQLLQRV